VGLGNKSEVLVQAEEGYDCVALEAALQPKGRWAVKSLCPFLCDLALQERNWLRRMAAVVLALSLYCNVC